MSDVFLGGGGAGIFDGLAPASGGYGGGGDLLALERTGRRMSALQRYASEFVTASPASALALAEGGYDDNEMLRSASQAVSFANISRLRTDLDAEDDEVARSLWIGLPEVMQESLRSLGYEPPDEKREGGNRFGLNLPDILPINELTLSRDTPILGGVGAIQAGMGEALEGVRDVAGGAGGGVLDAFAWMGEESNHLWRAGFARSQQEGQPALLGALTAGPWWLVDPAGTKDAWDETGKEDDYIRPEHEARARRLLNSDRTLLTLARGVAFGKTPEEIVTEAGFEPGSAEAGRLVMELTQAQSFPEFGQAVRELTTGKLSYGRVVTQGLGLDDTDAGWGRLVSGTLDAGFAIVVDPLLLAGKVSKAARFGRWAFTLEDSRDLGRGYRLVDAALEADRLRRGEEAAGGLARISGTDMRRGRAVLGWADRVAEGFSTGDLSQLMRDLPSVGTALDTMANSHTRRLADGLAGLDDTTGVLEWLKDRDGILALAGSRLGGQSPMVRGLRLPTLTARQRVRLQGTRAWTTALDWSRAQYGPGLGGIVEELGNPAGLTRSLGQWVVAHTAGDAGRFLSALTTHAPYKDWLPLYGNDSVAEFSRLVNAGMFTGMSRSTMDDYISAFAGGDMVTRSTQVEQFLRKLFDDAGIADTDFARKFVGRHHQVYATAGGDEQFLDALRTRGARLVDAQHGDALAIPTLRDFLRESRKTNMTRFLFHNTPASWADSALGRAWKPAVLMRIGFIPRAAGEELLHFALKHGPLTWLGAKGADWSVQESHRIGLENELREAMDLGDEVRANQLQSAVAGTTSALAPLRGLMAASDRMWMRAWDGMMERIGVSPETAWRGRLITKTHNLDEKGTVSGLERFANQLSLRTSGLLHWAADKTHIPSKGEVGDFLARTWNPDAAFAARLFIDDPTVARAYAEQISGSTLVPQEFRGVIDNDGRPVRKTQVTELRSGRPVLTEVELRPVPGEHRTLSRGVEQDPTFLDSVFARQRALVRGDRVGERVVSDILPRWTGGSVGQLPPIWGYADAPALRTDLNAAWGHVGADEDLTGKSLLGVVREYVDGDDFDPARRTWLAKSLTKLFRDSGAGLPNGRTFLKMLDEAEAPARHWLLYEHVNPEWLTDNFEQLTRQMRHSARARLTRPDMYRHLRESRLYQLGDEPMAVPVVNGIHKVYVPLAAEDVGPLGDDFIEAAVAHIKRIGGYGDERARRIAGNVAASSDTDELRIAVAEMTQRAVSAWGASDPRVAEAVMAAIEETTGVRPIFGILEVPDAAIQRSAGRIPIGLRTAAPHWKTADDWAVDPWRLMKTKPSAHTRRMTQLEVDNEWWDEVELSMARTAFGATKPGTHRLYTTNHRIWTEDVPDERFWFVDVPEAVPETAPLDVIESYGPHRLPAGAATEGWEPDVVGHQFSDGLPEIDAIDRVAGGAVDEALEILTTHKRTDLDSDVLHEVVEPLLRGDKVYLDEAGNKIIEPGYNYNHLVFGTKVDRLPWESYGPVYATARDSTWSKFVSEWFSGPVDHAVSAIIRKPMFLTTFGEQLRYTRGVADLFVDPKVHAAAVRVAKRLGLDADGLDAVVMGSRHEKVGDILADMIGPETVVDPADLGAVTDFVGQRRHGLDLARENALNRTMQLTIPFIDDHRIRSQFQQYVGNFIPFLFAEEQFLKRWARSIAESPEMIRRAQLMMNGLRSMGTVRKDAQGNEIFVYPGAGEATKVLSELAAPIFGDNLRVPYVVQMTGQVGYALPGIGDQVGVPSVGPLVAMPLEVLSRHFPEVADVEHQLVGRGADQPLWRYFIPSGGAKLADAMFGDIDSGQLASATAQAMLTMAVNGQTPTEGASPAERQEFIERARGQARFILATRAVFGMNAPAAPQIKFRSDELNDEFNQLLAAAPIDVAVQSFLASHPDIDAKDILAATVPVTEQEFGGLDMPTEAAARWMDDNAELIGGFPAAASWLTPRADQDDAFSFRAWGQQFALGLRRRKAPDELLNDVYFSAASRDYFEQRTLHEAAMLTAVGPARGLELEQWRVWKDAYMAQHPVFQDMLADPTRTQRRAQAVEELAVLSQDPEGPVPTDLAELINRYQEYKLATSGLRGDRRSVVEGRRRELTTEFATWALWHVERHPHLSAAYMRLIEPDLEGWDEDALSTGAMSG